jgi:hypothetical protein
MSLDEAWTKVAHAVASAGFILTDQVVQVVRVLAIGLAAWVGVEIISLSRQVVVLQTQMAALTTEVGALRGSVETRTDDRWRRSDHDRYAEAVEERLRSIERRMDNHSRAMSSIIAGKKTPLGSEE